MKNYNGEEKYPEVYNDTCETPKKGEISIIDKQFSDNNLVIKQLTVTIKNLQEKLQPAMIPLRDEPQEKTEEIPELSMVADKIRKSTGQIQSILDVVTDILNRIEL